MSNIDDTIRLITRQNDLDPQHGEDFDRLNLALDIVENTRRLRLSSAARGDTVSRLRRLAENLDNIGRMTLAAQNPNAQTLLPGLLNYRRDEILTGSSPA